jgi:hypothetical protein
MWYWRIADDRGYENRRRRCPRRKRAPAAQSSCTVLPTDPKSATFNFTEPPDWDRSVINGKLVITQENGAKVSPSTSAATGSRLAGNYYV